MRKVNFDEVDFGIQHPTAEPSQATQNYTLADST